MLYARSRVSLATGATGLALLAMAALANPALAEGEPTPLPDAISGPSRDTLLELASGRAMECLTFTGATGEQYSCSREVIKGVYYIVTFPVADALVLQAFVSGPLPWPDDHDQFLFDFAAPFCESTSTVSIAEFVMLARDAGPDGLSLDDRACRLFSDYSTVEIPVQGLFAWAKVDPTTLATLPPTLLPTLPPTAIPTSRSGSCRSPSGRTSGTSRSRHNRPTRRSTERAAPRG